jgi:hypothetical protein
MPQAVLSPKDCQFFSEFLGKNIRLYRLYPGISNRSEIP